MQVGERWSARPGNGDPQGDRLSRLGKAGLHINERLDVDTALRAAREGARALTRAPHSVIATLDDSSRMENHLALGLDANVVELMWQAPGGTGLLSH